MLQQYESTLTNLPQEDSASSQRNISTEESEDSGNENEKRPTSSNPLRLRYEFDNNISGWNPEEIRDLEGCGGKKRNVQKRKALRYQPSNRSKRAAVSSISKKQIVSKMVNKKKKYKKSKFLKVPGEKSESEIEAPSYEQNESPVQSEDCESRTPNDTYVETSSKKGESIEHSDQEPSLSVSKYIFSEHSNDDTVGSEILPVHEIASSSDRTNFANEFGQRHTYTSLHGSESSVSDPLLELSDFETPHVETPKIRNGVEKSIAQNDIVPEKSGEFEKFQKAGTVEQGTQVDDSDFSQNQKSNYSDPKTRVEVSCQTDQGCICPDRPSTAQTRMCGSNKPPIRAKSISDVMPGRKQVKETGNQSPGSDHSTHSPLQDSGQLHNQLKSIDNPVQKHAGNDHARNSVSDNLQSHPLSSNPPSADSTIGHLELASDETQAGFCVLQQRHGTNFETSSETSTCSPTHEQPAVTKHVNQPAQGTTDNASHHVTNMDWPNSYGNPIDHSVSQGGFSGFGQAQAWNNPLQDPRAITKHANQPAQGTTDNASHHVTNMDWPNSYGNPIDHSVSQGGFSGFGQAQAWNNPLQDPRSYSYPEQMWGSHISRNISMPQSTCESSLPAVPQQPPAPTYRTFSDQTSSAFSSANYRFYQQ